MKEYSTFSFENEPNWEKVPIGEINNYNWNSKIQYKTAFKLCLVKNRGIFLKMETDEKNIRAVCKERDENIWEDSCMEFFLKAFPERDEYINFEMNSKGVYLAEFGTKGRPYRKFIKELTDITPEISAKTDENGWSLNLFVPCELINELYGLPFSAAECIMKGNFYKCGDLTEKVHYGSYTEMTTLPPGFHNPQCFGNIVVKGE